MARFLKSLTVLLFFYILVENCNCTKPTTVTTSNRKTSTVENGEDRGSTEDHAKRDASTKSKTESATSTTKNTKPEVEETDNSELSSNQDIGANDDKFDMKPQRKYKFLFYKKHNSDKSKGKQKTKKNSHKDYKSNDDNPEFVPDLSEDANVREKKQLNHVDFEDDTLVRDNRYNEEAMLLEDGTEDLRKVADKVVSTFFFLPIVSIEETDKKNEIDLQGLEMMLNSLDSPTTEVKMADLQT